MIITCAIFVFIWIYLIRKTVKTKLNFWKYMFGSFGLFIVMMIFVRPMVTEPLAMSIAAISGVIGNMTHTFSAYFKYSVIFIQTITNESITMKIDMECSGIIEIMAYLSLLLFFDIYSRYEKAILALFGVFYIVLSNVIRIVIICEIIHFNGVNAYYMAHTLIGRIVFYILSILLYFYVFTQPQVLKMKTGNFSYNNEQEKGDE